MIFFASSVSVLMSQVLVDAEIPSALDVGLTASPMSVTQGVRDAKECQGMPRNAKEGYDTSSICG